MNNQQNLLETFKNLSKKTTKVSKYLLSDLGNIIDQVTVWHSKTDNIQGKIW